MQHRPAFAIGNELFTWSDVLLASLHWGDLAGLEAELREGVACVRHVLSSGRRPSEADEDAAANQFRRDRNLLAAADMEVWLQERHISLENWLRYIRRNLLRSRWRKHLPQLAARYPATSGQLSRGLWTVGICSGWFHRFAWKLAERAVASTLLAGATQGSAPATPPVAFRGAIPEWLGIPATERDARAARLAELETAYHRFVEETATADALRRQIAARHSDWVQVDFTTYLFAREADAREAMLCVREDGESLMEVADRSQARVRRTQSFLERLDGSLRPLLLSSPPGEPIGPVEHTGGSALLLIHEKTLPDPMDVVIRGLAEEAILRRVLDGEIGRRVQWRAKL